MKPLFKTLKKSLKEGINYYQNHTDNAESYPIFKIDFTELFKRIDYIHKHKFLDINTLEELQRRVKTLYIKELGCYDNCCEYNKAIKRILRLISNMKGSQRRWEHKRAL